MDPRLLAAIANMFSQNKLGDPSSAAFDPVQALLTGTYRPAPQFTEEQLYQKLAPTMMYAASEGLDSPYAIAASQIRAGTAPWTLKSNKELRGKINSKDWNRFIDDLAKETQAIRAKMLDMELEQDVFEKQGMRGLDAQFTPEDTYKYAPKAFQNIFQGLEEAQKAEADKFKKIDELYGRDVVLTKRDDVLEKLAKNIYMDPEFRKNALKGGSKDRFVKSLLSGSWARGIGDAINATPLVEYLGIDSPGAKRKRSSSKPEPFNDDQKKIVMAAARQKALSELEKNPLMSILDVGASTKLKAFGQGLKDAEARKTGTASNKMAQAGKLSEDIAGALTAAGVTPTMEDILRNLATRKALKNG